MSNSTVQKWLDLSPGMLETAAIFYRDSAENESAGAVCPRGDHTFRAFEYFPPEEIQVVILGQDPYYSIDWDVECGPLQMPAIKANGLAFGYSPEWTGLVDSSLLNMIREVGSDVAEFDRTLEQWARQGTLLLNTRLTVEEGRPLSHEAWLPHTTLLICKLMSDYPQIIWLALGREAQKLVREARAEVPGQRYIVEASHPSGLSHTRPCGDSPAFTGSGVFTRVNEILSSTGREPITWK